MLSLDPICFLETPNGKVYDTGLKKPNQRIDKLNDMNFVWVAGPSPTPWSERIEQLKAYKEEHGNLDIRRRHEVLGEWIHTTRKAKKENRLSEEKVQELTERK